MARSFKPSCRRIALSVCMALAVGGVAEAGLVTTYHVGNSLTYDMNPWSFSKFAEQRGLTHDVGYHILTGSSLNNTLANPNDLSVPTPQPYGNFVNALPNFKWNAVTIQPHTGLGSTMETDVASVLSLINLTRSNPENAQTRFYIYSTWPLAGNYQAQWSAPVENELSTPTTRSGQYFEHLLQRVRAETDATVLMVPVGDVLFELDQRLAAGEVPGYSSVSSFYRDGQHMKGGLGGYAAAVTAFATIRGQDPIGLTKPESTFAFDNNPVNAAAIYTAINDAVHDVVGGHPYSGIDFPEPLRADFDGSGMVDDRDLEILIGAFNKSPIADFNADHVVDGDDFLGWQRQAGRSSRKTSNFDFTDVNHDGTTDTLDLTSWRQSMAVSAAYDMDADGDSDGQDFLHWQRAVTPILEADFDGNFIVNGADLGLWKENNGLDMRADADRDGDVDLADLAIWQEEEGRVWPPPPPFPEAAAAPEPDAAVLTAAGLIIGAVRRRVRKPLGRFKTTWLRSAAHRG